MMEYRVYVRFEDSPAAARKNADDQQSDKYGPLLMEAMAGADPGEEETILHEALSEAKLNGKYVALYRGEPKGHDRRGRELFVPLGLAWCKDSDELAQMLGVARRQPAPQADTYAKYNAAREADSSRRPGPEPVSRYRLSTRPAQAEDYRTHSDSDVSVSRSAARTVTADKVTYQPTFQERANNQYEPNPSDYAPRPDRRSNGPRTPRERFAENPSKSWGWLAWAGIFIGCFVGAFVIVYGIASLLGH